MQCTVCNCTHCQISNLQCIMWNTFKCTQNVQLQNIQGEWNMPNVRTIHTRHGSVVCACTCISKGFNFLPTSIFCFLFSVYCLFFLSHGSVMRACIYCQRFSIRVSNETLRWQAAHAKTTKCENYAPAHHPLAHKAHLTNLLTNWYISDCHQVFKLFWVMGHLG